jgi:hypothetical protein
VATKKSPAKKLPAKKAAPKKQTTQAITPASSQDSYGRNRSKAGATTTAAKAGIESRNLKAASKKAAKAASDERRRGSSWT